jgi:hypothetical protein
VRIPSSVDWERAKEITSIPGVSWSAGVFYCTHDAAWAVRALLGMPEAPVPLTNDADIYNRVAAMPGLARYKELGLQDILRNYQKEDAVFMALRKYALNCNPMRCLSGDTEIIVNRGGNAKRYTLKKFVRKFSGGETRGRCWDPSVTSHIQSYDEESETFRLNEVMAVHTTGVKRTHRILLEGGKEIRATAEHRFLTDHGWMRLGDIATIRAPGSGVSVLTWERPKKGPKRKRKNNANRLVDGMWNHPYAQRGEYTRKGNDCRSGNTERYARVLKHRLVAEAVINNLPYEDYVHALKTNDLRTVRFTFLDPKEWHVHHRNEDQADNRPENLEVLRADDHLRHHAEKGHWKHCAAKPVWRAVDCIYEAELEETFDLTMADPLNNYVANGIVVHNSGKTLETLAAATLIDAKKILVVCPALAKFEWADQAARWLGEEAIILEGRAGTAARRHCINCEARGRMPDGEYCPACKMRNGQSRGYAKFDGERDAAELDAAISAARYVVVNYDLLVSQSASDAAGQQYYRGELPGWAPTLATHTFNLCIADEAHLLRGWTPGKQRAGQTRRERFSQVVEHIPVVWGVTGTLIYGFVRDAWGPLDAVSGGLWSGAGDRLPFRFHARYCEGHKDEYGWKADGRSIHAQTELKRRLTHIKIQRPRSEILKDMPAKVRQVVRIEPGERVRAVHVASKGDRTSKIRRQLEATAKLKRPTVVENLIAEMAEGNKVLVFALLRKNAEKLAKELEKACRSREHKNRMAQVHPRIWLAHGEATSESRFRQARAYREWDGAAAFVTTIDAVQVAISLNGATSVHFADLHWQPSAMLQAEDRPYEKGISGLTIVYYVVKGTIDEHIEAIVLPKVETLSRVVDEEGADEMSAAFDDDETETVDQLWDRLTAHMGGDK